MQNSSSKLFSRGWTIHHASSIVNYTDLVKSSFTSLLFRIWILILLRVFHSHWLMCRVHFVRRNVTISSNDGELRLFVYPIFFFGSIIVSSLWPSHIWWDSLKLQNLTAAYFIIFIISHTTSTAEYRSLLATFLVSGNSTSRWRLSRAWVPNFQKYFLSPLNQ